MNLTIKSKSFKISEPLQSYIEKKVPKLERHLPQIGETRVELRIEATRSAADSKVLQMTSRLQNGKLLRVEERGADFYTIFDRVLDKMQRQIDRYKGKYWDRKARIGKLQSLAIEQETALEDEEAEETPIVRVKSFSMIPMDAQEAIEQMELLGHDFFVFYNINNGSVNVLYRRRGKGYGLLQPELK